MKRVTYPLRYRIWLAAALGHLVLVVLGATYIGYSRLGKLEPALAYYGELSGSGSSYGFFAPGVQGQLRALFDVYDGKGERRTVTLETGASHEADLRVGNIIEQFTEDAVDPVTLQRSLSASLASTIFSRYPGARQVAVRLQTFYPVSMSDYRAGKRPSWSEIYQAKFEMASDAQGGGT